MDDLCKELEKMLKAGLGAVATGVEKAQSAVENFAQKGEPIYQQAKATVAETADKLVKIFQEIGKPRLEDAIRNLESFSREELLALRTALDALIESMPEEAASEEAAAQAVPADMQ